jgi:hypothetical protein
MKTLNYLAVLLVLATLTISSSAARVDAQTKSSTTQETDDPVKVELYTKFVQNYKTNKAVAHNTAKDYLRLYSKDNDDLSKYVQRWVDVYEKDERQQTLLRMVHKDRNFLEAFPVGKVVLADQPDQLDSLIALTAAGYLAANARNTDFDKETIAYAKRAIQLVESGRAPEDWAPYKGKEDTLAYLYRTLGWLQVKPAPNEAIDSLLKSVQHESELKKDPVIYYRLAQAYQEGQYAKLSADYSAKFDGKPESAESKQALEKLNRVIDVMIDAFARAVALAGSDAQYAQVKAAWLNTLTSFYKFRHENSDAGLTEFIAAAPNKPLPAKP